MSSPTTNSVSIPHRFIFNDSDMAKFLESPAKKELLQVTAAMGKSCATKLSSYVYDPASPLNGLSPAMAAFHGSLRAMLTWLSEFPPIDSTKARFGNPSFRNWHGRLVERSVSIVYTILKVHQEYPNPDDYEMSILEKASEQGYKAASVVMQLESIADEKDRIVVAELCAYLHFAFGHEMRLDYGTGHESSFQVFLYALLRLSCFGSTSDQPPTTERLKAVTLSIWSAYLPVTRQLQTDYMLEPAGSHGVWGLDDYHCLPFYFGACQLQADGEGYTPESIHDNFILEREGDRFLYFGCIRFIKSLKTGVPFFESSPMLNDISQLLTWQKVASGLLRLYEGEVLKKRQVVQHFVFGNIFAANWTPSQEEKEAPKETFRTQQVVGPMARAPWADEEESSQTSLPPPTKAPWAK